MHALHMRDTQEMDRKNCHLGVQPGSLSAQAMTQINWSASNDYGWRFVLHVPLPL